MKTAWASHASTPDINKALCDFIALRIWGEIRPFPFSTTMAVLDDNGSVCAAITFHNLDRQAGVIEASAASDTRRWLTRPILKEMFSYTFEQLGCQAVVMRTDPGNTRLHRILTAYGFEMTRLKRLRGRDKDEYLFTLYDDVWRGNGFHKEFQ